MKVISRGHKLSVELRNPDETLFAAAPIPDDISKGCVKTVDSSRGFALRLVDPNGKAMWVGISFGERNDAFDFYTSLTDFMEKKDMELNPEKYKNKDNAGKDWSLKSGEKVSFDFGGSKKQEQSNSSQPKK